MNPAQESRAQQLLTRIRSLDTDPKLQNLAAELERELNHLEANEAKVQERLAEFEAAYEKLTSPANRLGVFLAEHGDGQALIAFGDTEYVALLDPKLENPETLEPGMRVRLNEAYAVVGILPAHEGGGIIKVSEVLPGMRLRVGGDQPGASGRIVHMAASLAESKIESGDEVRIEPTGRLAVEHFPQQNARDFFMEDVPVTPWSAIGGQEEAIGLIRDTLELPLLHPELFAKFKKKPVKGILLYGPPGCGKTLIGKAIAHNLAKEYSERLGRPVTECFLSINGPKILNMWLGETERLVREVFATARKKAAEGQLVVLFIDEAESVLRTRSSGRYLNISNTVVPQFCAEMDGILGLENVVVVLTSNRPDYIDPAILRAERIDRKVKIRRPDRDATRSILSIYLDEEMPMDPALMSEFDGEPSCARKELIEYALGLLWKTSRETEFLQVSLRNGSVEKLHYKDLVSGALLKSVVDRSKDHAIARALQHPTQPAGLRREDIELAIEAEYRENEIFPKGDLMEDWLKLIDLEPENVAAIRPLRGATPKPTTDRVI